MPELPEVQTVVNDLNRKVRGRRVTGVWCDWPKVVKHPSPQRFFQEIVGATISRVARRGKNILIHLEGDRLLLIHQKMTGHLLVGKWKLKNGKMKSLVAGRLAEKVNTYLHLAFFLDDGRTLALSDLRKFAKVLFGDRSEILNAPDLALLGPEPLESEMSLAKFQKLIHAERRTMKQVLLDQEVIAGIGNIYADDILWRAKVDPLLRAHYLTNRELQRTYRAMRAILTKAIRLRGTSTRDFRDTEGREGDYTRVRLVYGREGEPCRRCRTKIRRVTIGGRSTHFCPRCQKIRLLSSSAHA